MTERRCFECETALVGVICPACNPAVHKAADEALAALDDMFRKAYGVEPPPNIIPKWMRDALPRKVT